MFGILYVFAKEEAPSTKILAPKTTTAKLAIKIKKLIIV
jgi:hypothetical protein